MTRLAIWKTWCAAGLPKNANRRTLHSDPSDKLAFPGRASDFAAPALSRQASHRASGVERHRGSAGGTIVEWRGSRSFRNHGCGPAVRRSFSTGPVALDKNGDGGLSRWRLQDGDVIVRR